MYEIVTSFENMNVAIKAAELLSFSFPMLTFEFREIPIIDLSIKDFQFPTSQYVEKSDE